MRRIAKLAGGVAFALITGVSCLLTTTGAEAQSRQSRADDRPLLELLGHIEGPDGYDDITGHAPIQPPRRLTRMTVAEVLEYQRTIRRLGAESTAVGRYQFILSTLSEMVDQHKIPKDALFDASVQLKLARALMDSCGFYDPRRNVIGLADCLAGKWAALPMASGEKIGKSRYQGLAGNSARTSLRVFLAVLENRFPPGYRPPRYDFDYAYLYDPLRNRHMGGVAITNASYNTGG